MTTLGGGALRGAAVLLAAAIGLATLGPERRALAHAVGVSSGEYRLDGQVLYGDIGLAGRELARWLPAIDTDHDGAIDADELTAGRDAVARAVGRGLIVKADANACPGSLDRAWVLEGEGGVVFQVRYLCPEVPGRLTLACRCWTPWLLGTATWRASSARARRRSRCSIGLTPPGPWTGRARARPESPGRC